MKHQMWLGIILGLSVVWAQGGDTELRFTVRAAEGPRTVRGREFIDEKHAWIGLYRSRDGGQTWELTVPPQTELSHFGGTEPYLVDTHFATVDRGWIVSFARRFWTWQTDDGGTSWRLWKPGAMRGFFFLEDGHGWTDLYDEIEDTYQAYLTSDWGKNWSACGGTSLNSSPSHVYFVGPALGWGVVESNKLPFDSIVQTNDGGCTWKEISNTRLLDRNPLRWVDVYFFDNKTGWLLGMNPGILLRTSNGGAGWQHVTLPRVDYIPQSVYFSSIDEGWVSGLFPGISDSDSGVFHTVDGGLTWKQLTLREFLTGSVAFTGTSMIPAKWKAGKLLQVYLAGGFVRLGTKSQQPRRQE